MTKIYDKILEKDGLEAAKAYMRSIRSKDKPAGGLHYASKEKRSEVARKASLARWSKRKKDDNGA